MTRRFEFADAMTSTDGTAISEWMRLADISADGCTVHEVRNVLGCLMSIRFEAADGWTEELRAKDACCENRLRRILRGWRRESLFGCDGLHELAAAF